MMPKIYDDVMRWLPVASSSWFRVVAVGGVEHRVIGDIYCNEFEDL